EGLLSPERDAGINDDTRIAPVGLGIVAHWIERRAPAAVDDVQLIARIATRAHGPDHIIEVGWIDVIVDDDGPAIVISPGVAMGGHHAGLLGMAPVQRLDRDHQHEPAAAGLMGPHPLDATNARRFELIPDRAATI